MTAEAGECNGRSEGSNAELEGSKGEFERKRGGDLKEGDIACRDGEEIGGSFVIVNGDSDDHSDRDLDLEEKSDPCPAAENGELVPENGEIGGKEESLAENGVEGDKKFSEENGGDSDERLVEERSNGAGIDIEQEKEAEVDAEDEPHVGGSGSVNEAKLDSDAQIEGEEVGDDVKMVKEEESEKKDNVDSGSDVKIEHEEEGETVESKDLGSGDAVEGKQDSEAYGIVAEEEEVHPRVEEREREAEVLIAESDAKVGLGSEDEEEDRKEPETVVTETDGLMKSESASRVEEEQEPVSVMAEVDDKGDVGEKSKNSVNGVGETENAAGFESAAETEMEPPTEVEQTENVVELEPAVKELKQESNTGVEETEESLESGSTVEVEQAQEPDTVDDETEKTGAERVMDTAEVEELKEPKVLVEKNDNQAETGSSVEVELEPEQEPETVLESADKIEAEERKEPEDVGKVNTASEQLPLTNGAPGKPNAVGDHPVDEPSSLLENGSTDSAGEINADSLKDDLNTEAGSIPLENSESLPTSHVTVKELVEEASHSSDDNIEKQEDINAGSVPSEPKTDVSSEERSLSVLVTVVDLEKQHEELCPHKDTETETKDSVANVEVDKDIGVDRMKQESESGNESAEGSECMVSTTTEGDQSTNKDDDKEPIHEQAQAAEMIQAPPETSVVKRHQVYMIKVPRFIDDELQKKIQDSVSEVEKKTDEREEISKETRKQAEIVNKYSLDYKAELAKERAVRAVFSAKRQELESKQELINRINNANSIADIDEKIRNMVHRQQHETISLKQEKQYIHDINQMKRLREQLSSKRASQEKIEEAPSQRDEVEVQLKNLKKELDTQRAALSSAENNTKSAWNKYMDEVQLLKSLKEKHNAADGERQEAYLHLKKLRNQSAEMAKHFKMYKADQSAATNYIFSGDNQGLRSHCSRQVERIMDLWNNNARFREQYVKCNMYSTLRKLGTLDGRSLGPGEEAPILRSVDKISNTISAPSSKIETPAPVLAVEVSQGNLPESSATKHGARTNQSAKLKSSTKPAFLDRNVPAVSNSEVSKETEKENKKKKEEEELARKADELARKEEELRKEKADELARKEEELRKEKAAKEEALRKEEKAAAELKEQLRLEQKTKAKEAEERKRRKVEKAQAKAEYRAQKEAELKEKKKAKKENKKSGTVDTTNGGTEGANSPVRDTNPPETSNEPEILSASTSKKRLARPALSMRQYNKVQPVPMPLRNRGKRKMTTWIWALLVILLVLVLFFAGNYISFSTSGLPDFGF